MDGFGATPLSGRRTRFRVWAPNRHTAEVRLEGEDGVRFAPLDRDEDGVFHAVVDDVPPGTRYAYRLDDTVERPDPYSRFQPDGVHGPSLVVNPTAFVWTDADYPGVPKAELVVYEIHVGTLTADGTYAAAIGELDRLRDLGITAVEVMPVAQTPGRWNWGYDGVNLFAPRNTYGTPDDFRVFVDACHARGIAVILDVVYNHVGPEGNYLADFGPYRSTWHHTPWGDALNYDGPGCGPVRTFVVDNAVYWLREFHVDGLRLDAAHFMCDDSQPSILDEIRIAVTEFEQSVDRPIHLIAETNVFDGDLLTPRADRAAYDALWCDEFAHAVYSIVTPSTHLTSRDYVGRDDLPRVLRDGYVFAGETQQRVGDDDRAAFDPDGTRGHISSLLVGLQTHDLVGNEPAGRRLHELASIDAQQAAAALHLLSPAIPLIFMGEETANRSRFRFFTDFEDPRLRRAVERGRRNEYPHEIDEELVGPTDPRAFTESRLGVPSDDTMLAWYRDLLTLRDEWRRAGLLASSARRIDSDSNLHTIVVSVRGHFVAVRLPPESAQDVPVRVEIDGRIVLDSKSPVVPETSSAAIMRTGTWAIVGEGHVSLMPSG